MISRMRNDQIGELGFMSSGGHSARRRGRASCRPDLHSKYGACVQIACILRWAGCQALRQAGCMPLRSVAVALLVGTSILSLSAAEPATNRFGFAGKEIFPIDHMVGHLRAADLDGDGLQDLLVVNNARSKINLLYNQTGQTNQPAKPKKSVRKEINELPPDARFRIDSIASEKRISSITVADLNGDNRPDAAYYGEPKELVVQYNEGTNTWSAPKRWAIEDGLLNPNALTHGDLNRDGRIDLLLLAEGHIYWLAQNANKVLAEPEKIPYSGTVLSVQVLDIQGDGRDDLLLCNWDSPNPFRFRLQNNVGQLGPEIHFTLPPIRSYWADDLDHDRKTEVITIAQKSGRAQIAQFNTASAESLSGAWRRGQFQVLPLNKTTKAKRGLVWADIDGDKLPDLLVAETDSGQLTVHLQQADATLAAPKTFATLTGVSEIDVADWDGDDQPDIFLLSTDERQIGVTKLDRNGRIAFPKVLPLEGRPLAIATRVLEPGHRPFLVTVVDLDGKRELQTVAADGTVRKQKLSESFKSNPKSLAIHDANQDGLADVIILTPYEKVKIMLQVAGKDFEEIDVTPPGGSSDSPWLSVCDVDGDEKEELLLAQKNFLRAVVLQKESADQRPARSPAWAFNVKEQINGMASNSRIVGAAAVRNGTNAVPSLFLLDAERKSVTLSERDQAGVWQVVRNLPLPVTDFAYLQPIAMGEANRNSIGFLGNSAVAWMTFRGEVWEFTELDGYETPIKDAFLHDVVSGDLNQDGRKDLVFLETSKSYLDVVTFETPHQLVPANRWQVFEERSFRSRRADAAEPREALVVDINNDGKNDLVVVVHDRIIVYPQE
ncbi:MAG: VCBS repeat-containing protein [Verrucomicrobia bacterium]|nr:VCBS repeat-containing protein [Verrucomicrobiota bacterium]